MSRPQPLRGKRILVCGKGGSGKSTLVAMMAAALKRSGYQVVVLDGDASNPEGLVRLLFGGGVEDEPKPLIEFFGGVKRVTCPVDDPGPLTRVGDSDPVPVKRIDLTEEIDAAYYLRDENLRLVAHVRVVIIDHHLMRDSSGPDWLNALSKTTGKRVSCAAD